MQYFKKESSVCVCVCVCAQLCLTLCGPMNCSLQAPLPTRHGIFKDHLKLCLTTTNKNAKKQTELLSCVETFCNNGEVCVSACVCWGRGAKIQLAKLQRRHSMYRMGRTWKFHPHTKRYCAVSSVKRWHRNWGEQRPQGMNQLSVWKHLQVLSNLPAPFKSFQGHKQETARYDLTWVSTSLEKSLPQRAMNKVWSQRVRGEEDREFKFRVWSA